MNQFYITTLTPEELAELIEAAVRKVLSEPSDGPVPEQLTNEVIDRKELCKRLAITGQTAIRWEKKGKIPFFKIGSSVRYNWQTVLLNLEKKKK